MSDVKYNHVSKLQHISWTKDQPSGYGDNCIRKYTTYRTTTSAINHTGVRGCPRIDSLTRRCWHCLNETGGKGDPVVIVAIILYTELRLLGIQGSDDCRFESNNDLIDP